MNQKFNTVELTKMALLTALICVSAYIVIPLPFTPASLTAQTLVVNLIALLLTPRQAAFTMVVYILLGLTGLLYSPAAWAGPESCSAQQAAISCHGFRLSCSCHG